MQLRLLPCYLPVLQDKASRFVLLQGGAGSGKSYFAAQWVLTKVMTQPFARVLCVRKYRASTWRTVWQELLDLIEQMGISHLFTVNKNEQSLRYVNGNLIWFGGLDNPEKIKSLKGVGFYWLEEATELNMDDFGEVNRRARVAGSQMLLSYNPISTHNWIYRYFFEQGLLPNASYHTTTYRDNPFLPAEVKAEYERYQVISPYHWQVYGMGAWGQAEGTIFPAFTVVEAMPERPAEVFYGLDFGYSNSPTALVRVAVHQDNYYIQELLYETGLTIVDIARKMQQLGVERAAPVYCDAAEPASIELLSRGLPSEGIGRINAHPAAKDVKAGIDKVLQLWPRLRSHAGNVHLHKEQTGYVWRKTKDGETLNEPVKAQDHLCFRGDTGILMADGTRKRIDAIEAGDMVWTLQGPKPVIRRYDNGVRPVENYEMHSDTKNISLWCTKSHKIWTAKGWKPISQLTKGMTLCFAKTGKAKPIGCIQQKGILSLTNITYTKKYGSILMGQYQ